MPFGVDHRIIGFTLANCMNSGIRRAHLLMQYQPFLLDRHIAERWLLRDSGGRQLVNVIPAKLLPMRGQGRIPGTLSRMR